MSIEIAKGNHATCVLDLYGGGVEWSAHFGQNIRLINCSHSIPMEKSLYLLF